MYMWISSPTLTLNVALTIPSPRPCKEGTSRVPARDMLWGYRIWAANRSQS